MKTEFIRKFSLQTLIFITAVILSLATSCKDKGLKGVDFRYEMRTFVGEISMYARSSNPTFIIIPQNGEGVVNSDDDPNGTIEESYFSVISGIGREDLFYGYENDNESSPSGATADMNAFLSLYRQHGKVVLVTDYCSDGVKMDDSYFQNASQGYISFAAPQRDLNIIPSYPAQPYHVNSNNINSLDSAQNFLYLINPENYSTKDALLAAIAATNYDAVIMDIFFDDQQLQSTDLDLIRFKNNGGRRLLICYMSIGEAEDYRWYWNSDWAKANGKLTNKAPDWMEPANPKWPGNYKVRYWYDDWKKIIYGSSDAYLDRIIAVGFDGVYLDIIDAYEYFEGN